MATTNLTTAYETKDMTIKADADGMLYMTSNATTDELITPWLYSSWTHDQIEAMGEQLVAEGMPQDVADQIVRQALGSD